MQQSKALRTQAVFLSGVYLLLGSCKQSVPPKIATVPTLSVEELLANPQSQAHTMVNVSGCFVLGLESVTWHPDIEALDRSLGQGMRATIDKRIAATFTGRFVLRDSYSSRPRFVLNIERIDHLKVTPINLKPHVPR